MGINLQLRGSIRTDGLKYDRLAEVVRFSN
jgi:hypothetical protein